MGENRDTNNTGGEKERVTIREAATLLGVHPNTVRNHVKAGMYSAEKVVTERGETWMIDRGSLTTNTPTSARQQGVGGVPAIQQEAIQELARAIVREAQVARDPEQEARLEGNKLQVEAAKTQVIVASGSLVGMAAIVSVLSTYISAELLVMALLLIFLSLMFAFVHMQGVARETAAQRYAPDWFLLPLGSISLVLGLLVFAVYVVLNLPVMTDEGNPMSIGEKLGIVVRAVEFGTLVAVLFGLSVVVWRIRRRRASRRASERES